MNDPCVHVTWDDWAAMGCDDVDDLIRRIADQVGGVRSFGVEPHEYARRHGRVARFVLNDGAYALVPGGEVSVGFDASGWVPSPEQLASYQETAREYGLRLSIIDYVAQHTSPRRIVMVPTLLVAVEATQAGLVALATDDDSVHETVASTRQSYERRGRPTPPKIELAGHARIMLNPDWTVREAWRYTKPTLAEETQRLAALGRRLLSPDEWEHSCGAGASSLFRWGSTYPAAADPRSLDAGPHRDPNLFGLHIGEDPYRDERTSDPTMTCGGDGGATVSGGAGEFVSWLTIATAYRDERHARFIQQRGRSLDKMLVRPAIDLSA